MNIQTDILKSAIYDLKEIYGVSYAEMQRKSGVHNISRIMSGAITPYADTWQKLHTAYPEHIPAPVYIAKDGRIYQTNTNGPTAADQTNTIKINNTTHQELTPGMVFLCQMISAKKNPDKICADFLRLLDDYE